MYRESQFDPSLILTRRMLMTSKQNLPQPAAAGAGAGFVMLVLLLGVVWIAGGASRADVSGQILVRTAAWLGLVGAVLFLRNPNWSPIKDVLLIVTASVGLVALQLIPLPPALWTSLPGREIFFLSAQVAGLDQPWRPVSISPGATRNALSSLVVPMTVTVLCAGLSAHHHRRLLGLILVLVALTALIGLLEFAGDQIDYPFINDQQAAVSANFANRNHFALFCAFGCLLAPIWTLRGRDDVRWRMVATTVLLALLVFMVISSGSRAGLVLAFLGLALGVLTVRQKLGEELGRLPRAGAIAAVAGVLLLVLAPILAGVAFEQAISLERALSLQAGDDMRAKALPTILTMIANYFPAGAGFGTFDAAYRIEEPDALLSVFYLNHAHSDIIEVVLDGGIVAGLIFAAALCWIAWKSWRAWRGVDGSDTELARAGSGLLILVLLASAVDYPARTPLIMAMVVLGAVWLALGTNDREPSGRTRATTGR